MQQRLVATWAVIQHSVVYGVIDQWPKRLEACTNTEGGQSNTTGSFQSHQCQSTTQSRPTFERTQQIFSQMKKSHFTSQCGDTHTGGVYGQVGYSLFSSEITLINSMTFWILVKWLHLTGKMLMSNFLRI